MSFNLSVVNIVPDAHKDNVNQIAELYGCGKDNLSVKLKNANGDIFWACHAFWQPEDYAFFSDDAMRAEIIPAEIIDSLQYLYERLVLDGDAQENWLAALSELGLEVFK